MIHGEKFMIYETDDITNALKRLEIMAQKIKEMVDDKNPAVEPFGTTERIVGDIFTALAAAGIGAAVCERQGGIVAIQEDATEADQKEAIKILDALRKKKAALLSDGIPVQ